MLVALRRAAAECGIGDIGECLDMSRLITSIAGLVLFAFALPLKAQEVERPQEVDVCALLARGD